VSVRRSGHGFHVGWLALVEQQYFDGTFEDWKVALVNQSRWMDVSKEEVFQGNRRVPRFALIPVTSENGGQQFEERRCSLHLRI